MGTSSITVKCYVACSMSGQEKPEMIARAKRVCEILRESGITPISPVIEENVKDEPGKLINSDKDKLLGFWTRDKEILVKEAHVMLWDHAERHSHGATREYCLARGVLWKPVVVYIPQGSHVSVAPFEDDLVVSSIHEAAKHIVEQWGTRQRRWKWRTKMLLRTLPKWLWRQVLAWR